MNEKPRIIQEYVPGKQVTLAHLIANPKKELCEKLGLTLEGAIGILTITPTEAVIIAADIATKSSTINIIFVDRFTGTLIIGGTVSAVKTALVQVNDKLSTVLLFSPARQTES